jgi:hypothetical protein
MREAERGISAVSKITEAEHSLSGDETRKRLHEMRLKVIDRETGERRYCTLDEAKTWDWANPEVWRIISRWQITSYKKFLSMLLLKADKGQQEVEILEAPRFTMLSGG